MSYKKIIINFFIIFLLISCSQVDKPKDSFSLTVAKNESSDRPTQRSTFIDSSLSFVPIYIYVEVRDGKDAPKSNKPFYTVRPSLAAYLNTQNETCSSNSKEDNISINIKTTDLPITVTVYYIGLGINPKNKLSWGYNMGNNNISFFDRAYLTYTETNSTISDENTSTIEIKPELISNISDFDFLAKYKDKVFNIAEPSQADLNNYRNPLKAFKIFEPNDEGKTQTIKNPCTNEDFKIFSSGQILVDTYNPKSNNDTNKIYINQAPNYDTSTGKEIGPGGRRNAVTWVDSKGNFWLFGGSGYGSNNILNDLWVYNPTTQNWLLKDAPDKRTVTLNDNGKYSGDNQRPSNRTRAASWIDKDDNLWLFSGARIDTLTSAYINIQDFWKYDTKTEKWEQVTTTNTAPQTYPTARQWAATWVDKNGNLWLWGGSIQGSYALNDLWKFNISTSTWILIQPSSNLSPIDRPLPSFAPAFASDKDGNMWLAFGNGNSGVAPDNAWTYRTTVWKFTPGPKDLSISDANQNFSSDGSWTSVTKAKVAATDVISSYNNNACEFNNIKVPCARNQLITWFDKNGHFFIFGGQYGIDGSNLPVNDVWEFDHNQWNPKFTIDSGYNNFTNAKKSSCYSEVNFQKIGSRAASLRWLDKNGVLWVYGGNGYADDPSISDCGTSTTTAAGALSDMWQIYYE